MLITRKASICLRKMRPLRFQIGPTIEIVDGLFLRSITFPAGPAQGRAVTFCVDHFEPAIYPFYELINKSFNPKSGYCPPPEKNLGVNVPQLLDRSKPEAKGSVSREDIGRCVFACNTLHTNFVRGNGFVIVNGELVYKPPGAVALDGNEYRPVGFHPDENPDNTEYFPYQALSVASHPPKLRTVRVNRNTVHDQAEIKLAISGPAVVESSKNVVRKIPVRMKAQGQTVGDEINYDPFTLRTSFTAFGIERGSKRLIVVSMFAGRPGRSDDDTTFFAARPDEGITLNEMAELMRRELKVSDAIAGGGAGDTQQYIYGRGIWAGQPRHQPDRPQVRGLRGLGAIFALLREDHRVQAGTQISP